MSHRATGRAMRDWPQKITGRQSRNQNRTCPQNTQNTQINADTENEFFVCVRLRVLRAKAFSLIPCLHQENSSPLCVILPECSAACCQLICQPNRGNILKMPKKPKSVQFRACLKTQTHRREKPGEPVLCSAVFQNCPPSVRLRRTGHIADFQIGTAFHVITGAGLEAREPADFEACATACQPPDVSDSPKRAIKPIKSMQPTYNKLLAAFSTKTQSYQIKVKSVTSGKAGGMEECEPLKAVCFVPLAAQSGISDS